MLITVALSGAFDHILQYAVGDGWQRERPLLQTRQRLRGLQIAVAVGAYRQHGDQTAFAQRRAQQFEQAPRGLAALRAEQFFGLIDRQHRDGRQRGELLRWRRLRC